MESRHDKALVDLRSDHEASLAQKVKELELQRAEALALAVSTANAEAREKAAFVEQEHRAALEAAVERSRQSGQAEVRNLKKRHQDAVAQIRSNAQKQTAALLTELEQSHANELQAGLEEARAAIEKARQESTEYHQGDMLRLETEQQSQLTELENRLQSEKEAELSQRQSAFALEIAALQSRLDASFTGHAEAERALAGLRQQVSQAERRTVEAKQSSDEEVTSLKKEKEDLTSQLEKVQTTLRELQSKYSTGANTPKMSSTNEELASIKLQLDSMEEERAGMRLTLQKKLDEKTELSRQNDFLIKELEALLAQRARPGPPARNTSDALVQTEQLISEPKVDLASIKQIQSEKRKSLRPVTPMSPGRRQAKDEVDMAWSARSFEDYLQDAHAELSELGSVITANEQLFSRKIEEHVGELQRAKDQLALDYQAKLEKLAGDKERMEKMVTSTQVAAFARDRKDLVAQYDADFDDPGEQAAMLSSLPVGKARALRTAEQRLVQDYNKRIAKRKSQIALKHAEKFQSITQEYDRKIAELLNNRHRLEGDLSLDPSRFEDEFGDLRTQSEQLRAEKAQSAYNSPQTVRTKMTAPAEDEFTLRPRRQRASDERPQMIHRTSNPRNSTSLPRSSLHERRVSPEPPAMPRVPFPGSRDSPEATSQPFRGRERYAPAPQRSLMRAKGPSDVHPRPQQRVASAPSPTKRPASRRTNGNDITAHDLSVSAADFERSTASERSPHLHQDKRSRSKPGFLRRVKDRISLDGHRPHVPHFSRPVSSSGRPASRSADQTPTRLEPTREPESEAPASETSVPAGPAFQKGRRSRSKQLSSGMIYYQAPRQKSPVVEYD